MKGSGSFPSERLPINEAKNRYFSQIHFHTHEVTQWVATRASLRRITARPVLAQRSVPGYHGAAMDGIGVRAEDTQTASPHHPLTLLKQRDFIPINTGGYLPPPYDAVIMAEDLILLDGERVQITSPAQPWQHVRLKGEDMQKGDTILGAYRQIGPLEIGALLAAGIRQVEVLPLPRVGILPTGSEIIDVEEEPSDHQIIDSNSGMLSGMVTLHHGLPTAYAVAGDDKQLLKQAISQAVAENDLVIIIAGSSAGPRDYTAEVLDSLGQVLVHGVAAKPGKPMILAMIDQKPVLGLPGFPASAYTMATHFLIPLLYQFNRLPLPEALEVQVPLAAPLTSSAKVQESVRMKLVQVSDKLAAFPLERRSSSTMSLLRADGILTIPQGQTGYGLGTRVPITLQKPLQEISSTLLVAGSPDPVLDLLDSLLGKQASGTRLFCLPSDNLSGLQALQAGHCHFAAIRLLEEGMSPFSLSYIKRIFSPGTMALIPLLKRQLGLLVAKGNPKQVTTLQEAMSLRLRPVYRPKEIEAGTLLKVLAAGLGKPVPAIEEGVAANTCPDAQPDIQPDIWLDIWLEQNGLAAPSFLAVAAAISGGNADWGLGTFQEAQAAELDFLPHTWETYGLLIPLAHLKTPPLQQLLQGLRSADFQRTVGEGEGYAFIEPDILLI